jgi:hypothetical protein
MTGTNPLDEHTRYQSNAMQGIGKSTSQQSLAHLGSGKRSEGDLTAAV